MIEYCHKVYDNNILLDEISDILEKNGEVVLKAKGNSMRPFIRNEIDSVVLIKPGNVVVGDVVLANVGTSQKHHYVLHRIFKMDGDRVTLMGDGNIKGTESCRIGDISGKAIYIQRPSGRRFAMPKGRIWKALLPIRRYLLAIYIRMPKFLK